MINPYCKCKPIVLDTDAKSIIESVAAMTGKSTNEIVIGAVNNPRFRVIANFQTQEQNPIACLIDEYQMLEASMIKEKSAVATVILIDFLRQNHVYIDNDKTVANMNYFIECLETVTREISDITTPFHTTLCNWDVVRLSHDRDKLGATKEQFLQLLEAMIKFYDNPAIYANSKLFRIFVVLLRDCLETADDLYQKMQAAGKTDYTIKQARRERPQIDWQKSYKFMAPIIELMFL